MANGADFELETAMTLDTKKGERDLKKWGDRGEKEAKKVERAIKKSGEQGFGGFVQFAARGVAAMGTVELGIKSVNAATAALRGDLGEASEIIKQLPAGIGPVAQGLEAMLKNVTGMTKELAKFQSINETIGSSVAIQGAISDRTVSERDKLALIHRQIQQDLAVEQAATEEDRSALRARFALENRESATRARINAAVERAGQLTPQEQKQLQDLQDRASAAGARVAEARQRVESRSGAGGIAGRFLKRRAVGELEQAEAEQNRVETAIRGIRARQEEAKADPELLSLQRQSVELLNQLVAHQSRGVVNE